jgi:hypothetical protein
VPTRRVHPRRGKVGVRVDVVRRAPGRRRIADSAAGTLRCSAARCRTVCYRYCGARWVGAADGWFTAPPRLYARAVRARRGALLLGEVPLSTLDPTREPTCTVD